MAHGPLKKPLDFVGNPDHVTLRLGLGLGLVTNNSSLKRLVQNAAARLVTGARRSDHVSPVLKFTSLTTISAAHTLQNCNVGAQVFKRSCTTISH